MKINAVIILILISVVGYFYFIKVPNMQDRIDSFEWQEPEVVYLPGKIDTITVVDTLTQTITQTEIIEIPSQTPDETREYKTAFEDSLIQGNIYSIVSLEGRLQRTWLDYNFKKPIYSTSRVDTIITTKTLTETVQVATPKTFRVQIGATGALGPNGYGIGPSVQILNKRDNAFSYSYDAVNQWHLLTFHRTIRLW